MGTKKETPNPPPHARNEAKYLICKQEQNKTMKTFIKEF